MWAVMKAMAWTSMDTPLYKFQMPEVGTGQPQRFIPLFESRQDAVEFADGDESLIAEMCTSKLGGAE